MKRTVDGELATGCGDGQSEARRGGEITMRFSIRTLALTAVAAGVCLFASDAACNAAAAEVEAEAVEAGAELVGWRWRRLPWRRRTDGPPGTGRSSAAGRSSPDPDGTARSDGLGPRSLWRDGQRRTTIRSGRWPRRRRRQCCPPGRNLYRSAGRSGRRRFARRLVHHGRRDQCNWRIARQCLHGPRGSTVVTGGKAGTSPAQAATP